MSAGSGAGAGVPPIPPLIPPSLAGPPLGPVVLPSSIPAAWLREIKDAVKANQPSMLMTLLGSSLLSAVIAAGTAFGTAYFTIKANGDLEIRKAELAARQDALKESLSAYDRLDEKFSQLLIQLKGVSQLIQITQAHHRPSANIRNELQSLGVSEGTILALKADSHFPAQIWQVVDPPLGDLARAIHDADSDLGKFPAAAAKIELDLSKAIEVVRHQKVELQAGYFK
jgi:hypothetical protein